MPRYRWERSEAFRDHANDRRVNEGEVVELSEAIAEGQPGFVRVEDAVAESDDGESESEGESSECAEDGCGRNTTDEYCWQHPREE